MNKLANLRGNNTNSEAAIFSNKVDASTSAIFARMQGKQVPQQNRTTQRKKYVPSRFRVAKGETKSLVIVDEQFTFAMREHSHKNSQGKWETVRCIADYDSCPCCALPDHRPHDVILLTVLDLTSWTTTDKNGNEVTYEYTKRVLALKTNDYKAMKIIASTTGSLRGLLLDMSRGYGEKESANGVPNYVNKLTEEQLIEMFGTPEKKYDSGFIVPANNAIVPFNYAEIFAPPTRAELAAHLGVAPRPGSKEELQETEETPPWDEVEVLDLGEELPDVE